MNSWCNPPPHRICLQAGEMGITRAWAEQGTVSPSLWAPALSSILILFLDLSKWPALDLAIRYSTHVSRNLAWGPLNSPCSYTLQRLIQAKLFLMGRKWEG